MLLGQLSLLVSSSINFLIICVCYAIIRAYDNDFERCAKRVDKISTRKNFIAKRVLISKKALEIFFISSCEFFHNIIKIGLSINSKELKGSKVDLVIEKKFK